MTKLKQAALVAPDGYALISIDALKAWGKYDEVRNACQFPAEQAEQEQVAVLDITHGREPECYATPNADDLPEGTYRLYAAPVRTKDLTDGELEDAFKELGGKWNGDMWTIEDADLHPCLRKLICNGYGE